MREKIGSILGWFQIGSPLHFAHLYKRAVLKDLWLLDPKFSEIHKLLSAFVKINVRIDICMICKTTMFRNIVDPLVLAGEKTWVSISVMTLFLYSLWHFFQWLSKNGMFISSIKLRGCSRGKKRWDRGNRNLYCVCLCNIFLDIQQK